MTSSTFATLDAPRDGRDAEHETDPLLDELVQLAATVCGTRMAAVSIIDEHRQTFAARPVDRGVRFVMVTYIAGVCAWAIQKCGVDSEIHP